MPRYVFKYWVNTGKMMPARVPRGRSVSLIPPEFFREPGVRGQHLTQVGGTGAAAPSHLGTWPCEYTAELTL